MKASKSEKSWISGSISTAAGDIPVVDTKLRRSDKLGSYKARWGIGRMKYRVEPGLYAAGAPDADSPVFVSANYKMSFDRLRSNLTGIDCWIMVLDTNGINVWCAAGKGTFGTDEIVGRIDKVGLEKVVSHRKLIIPQLGATGVSAHRVRERSGFHIIFGPVRAEDIPAFMKAGKKATPEMRRVRFSLKDRAVLIPNELVQSAKYLLIIAFCFILLSGLGPGIYSLERVWRYGVLSSLILVAAYIAGTAIPPILLPWLPGRSFSLKGAWVGFALAIAIGIYSRLHPESFDSALGILSWIFIVPAIASFMAMNFTGCSTYTSLSGVKKEMRFAVPAQIAFAAAGLGLWITGLFT